jgi:hypothetical protein
MAASDSLASLRRLDATDPGRGAWRVLPRPERRSFVIEHRRTRSRMTVFYGTRTERTLEDAEAHAIAMCAVLNALKAKRI